jgi:DNA-binding PadR family transcriptional regulator
MHRHHHHHHISHFFGRHGGGRGFGGRFGGWFAEGGELGGRGFGMGRKLASSDLQLLILGLLADKPRHGYEIIKALDELSKGFYAPSPGMVYPALTYLEELGHATVETEGTRKRYHITEGGRQYLEEHRTTVDALFTQFERVGERMQSLRRAMRSDDEEGHGHQAEEQERIADILRRAAEEIAAKK